MENLIKIKGEVDKIVYKSENNEFCVLMLKSEEDLITVVGEFGDIEEGEELILTGNYTNHRKFGKQFRVSIFERSLPITSASIQRYLSGGAISGIGPVLAKKLVSKFGDKTLEIIESEPEKLTEIEGINTNKAKKIQSEFKASYAVRSLMTYLSSYEIPTSFSVNAWKRWGDSAEEMIKNNPYVLCSKGVELPFKKADEIGIKQDFSKDNPYRIKAGIEYVLKVNSEVGHTCLPMDKLVDLTSKYIKVTDSQVEEVVNQQIKEENLYVYYKKKRPFVFFREFFTAENYIANRLAMMRSITYDNKIDFSVVIDLEEENNNIKYEETQRRAINLALSKGFLVLTGGPGTGKTTTLNAIISLYKQQGLNVMIAAPTGRAAKRISDLTGYEAKTIHRLLEVQISGDNYMNFVHNENNLLECDALIIDEMSMVDSCIFEALLRAISVTCKLVLVGDSDQLPSVGAGNVLKDIIDSGVMSVIGLKEIFRQSRESDIVMNAHKIVKGEQIDFSKRDKDFFFFQRLDYESLQNLVIELCKERLPKAYKISAVDDIQVLSPTKKGPSGTVELNRKLQNELNPPQKGVSEIKTPKYIYRVGDKVMQTVNDYDVIWKKEADDNTTESGAGIFNGDIGIIVSANKILNSITINFEGRLAVYNGNMLDNLELAYAITVHKSQGSEFDVVILTVFGGYDKLYYRNLLYTAVTRAKKMLIIVGSMKRVNFMIENNRRNLRYTALRNMLMENVEGDDSGQQKFDI